MGSNNQRALSAHQEDRKSRPAILRREYAQGKGQGVNEPDARVGPKDDEECQQITPRDAAQLNIAPRKVVSAIQGKSSGAGRSNREIHSDDLLNNGKHYLVNESNRKTQAHVQLRPERSCSEVETNGNVQLSGLRRVSRIHQSNGIESHPSSHVERRVEFARRRSTGSFREALVLGCLETGPNIENKVPDCGFFAHSIETDTAIGCPRDSIDACIRRQDSTYDVNPDPEHYPIRRNSTGCTMVYPDLSTEDKSIYERIFSYYTNNGKKSTDFRNICKEQIMVQHPEKTGCMPFGCHLHAYRYGAEKWYHFLRLDNTPKSLARQLHITDNDEVLIIDDSPVVSLDQEQVLMKFMYILKERKIWLVIRRMISMAGGGFEYIEIKAKITVGDTLIKAEKVQCVGYTRNATLNGASPKKICFGNQYVCVRNSDLALTNALDDSAVFVQTIYTVWRSFFKKEFVCTLYNERTQRYITFNNSIQLTSPQDQDTDLKLDNAFVIREISPSMVFLEHEQKKGCYLAYEDSRFCLLVDPISYRDNCLFVIRNA